MARASVVFRNQWRVGIQPPLWSFGTTKKKKPSPVLPEVTENKSEFYSDYLVFMTN